MKLVAVVLVVVVAGCGGDTEPTTAPAVTGTPTTATATVTTLTTAATAPVTTTVVSATSVAPVSTTAVAETTTTTSQPASVCPAPLPLDDVTLLTAAVAGDFDGDGAGDELLTYQSGPGSWRVRVVFSDGGGADAAISDAEDLTPPRPIGGFDIDADGADEVFLTVGAGASTTQVGFFDVSNCVATRVTAGGSPASFGVGGSIGMVSGLVCPGDGSIQRTFASYVSEDAYEGGLEPFTLEGSALSALPGDGASFTADEAFALATLDCGSLSLP